MKSNGLAGLVYTVIGIGLLFLLPALICYPTLLAGTPAQGVVKVVTPPSRQSKTLYVVAAPPGAAPRQYYVSVGRSDAYSVGDRVNVIVGGSDTALLDRGLASWLEPLVPFMIYLLLVVSCAVTWFRHRPKKLAS